MGGSRSKSAVTSLAEQITNISQSLVQDCVVNTGQTQTVSANNAGWSFNQTLKIVQKTSVSSSCFASSSKQIQLQNSIEAAVKNTAEASGVSLLSAIGASKTEADTKLHTMIKNNVTLSNVQKNYNNIVQNQDISLNNAATGVQIAQTVDITQGAEVFVKSVLKTVEDAGIFNALSQSVDQSSTSKTIGPLDFIQGIVGSITSSIAGTFIAIATIFIVIIGAILYMGTADISMPTLGEASEPATTPTSEPTSPTTVQ
jgi:hypothetical protein